MITLPTIAELKDNILDELEAEFSISVNPLGLSFLVAFATVLAGLLWLVYLSIGFTQKQIWFDTADSVANGGTLERFGVIILKRYPFAATSGQYTCSVTGTAGAVIPATMVFKSDDNSESPAMLFQIDGGAYTLTGSGDTITINALTGGLISRLAVGNTLTATAPMINVNSIITVTVEDVVPIDAETIEEYRAKIKEKVQLVPGSWSAVDYRLVGITVAGVGQTYAYADSGDSAVVNVFLQGTTPVANPGPSVSPTVITNYETALNAVLPLSVWDVNVAASTIRNVVVTITMGSFPVFTATQKTDIENALEDFVNNVHPFIAAADDVADRNDVIATYNLSAVISGAVPGYGFSGVTFTVAGTPTTLWEADNGEISYLNSVAYA